MCYGMYTLYLTRYSQYNYDDPYSILYSPRLGLKLKDSVGISKMLRNTDVICVSTHTVMDKDTHKNYIQ